MLCKVAVNVVSMQIKMITASTSAHASAGDVDASKRPSRVMFSSAYTSGCVTSRMRGLLSCSLGSAGPEADNRLRCLASIERACWLPAAALHQTTPC